MVDPLESKLEGLTLIGCPTLLDTKVTPEKLTTGGKAPAATDRLTAASEEAPAELFATIIKLVAVKTVFGVPDITQVFGFTDAHGGSVLVPLLIPQLVITAPLFFKDAGDTAIAEPVVPFMPLALEKLSVGGAAATDRMTTASDELPATLVATSV